jgi:uncharacterized membrane protein YebE (DUF533 family)
LSVIGFLGPLLSATMGSRRKKHARAHDFLSGSSRGFVNAGNLLALGGLGWAAYEIWRSKQRETQLAGAGRAVVPGTVVEGGLPPPIPSAPTTAAPAVQNDVQRVVDLTLAAARSDGELGEEEFGRILATARDIGAEPMVRSALEHPRSLAEIVRGISDRKQREALYVYAFSIVRADEDVTTAERTWLQQLASQLGLDAGTTSRLEKETAYRIASMPAPE